MTKADQQKLRIHLQSLQAEIEKLRKENERLFEALRQIRMREDFYDSTDEVLAEIFLLAEEAINNTGD